MQANRVVFELKGLRPENRTRPGDVVVMEFYGPGHHLVIDASATTVFRNTVLGLVASIPGYAAAEREASKFTADQAAQTPISRCWGGRHTLVPFAVEEGGRMGAHALALLRQLAERGVASGHLRRQFTPKHPAQCVAYWVRRWMRRISATIHFSLSRQLLRQTHTSPLDL